MAAGGIAQQESPHRRVFQDAATVGALTSITKIAAAAKVIVMARYFGASDDLDAYLIAFLIPSFVVDTVAGTFTPSLVPALIRANAFGPGNARSVAQSGLAMVLAPMMALMAILALTGRWILPWMGSSFSDHKLELTVTLFLSMLVWLPLGACSATWRAVLNARGHVALASGVHLVQPALTILFLFAGVSRWGVRVLVAAVALGAMSEFTVLGVAVRRMGFSLRPKWLGWTGEMRSIWSQYWPMLAGTTITAGCGLVDQSVAGSLGSGSVSALSYGVKVASVLVAVGGTGMATAVLPEFSRLVTQEKWAALRHALRVHVGLALAVMIPVSIFFIWASAGVVRVVYQRGQFGPEEAAVVADIQRYAVSLAPFAVVLIIAQRLATALGRASLILRAGVVAMATNIAGDLLLPRWMGVSGVALASCLAHIAFMAALLAALYRAQPRLFRADDL